MGLARRLGAPRVVHGLAVTSLVLQVVLVATGGAVRVTGSGLGCPSWPRCTPGSLTNTAAQGLHGWIEFGNRTLFGVMETVAVLLVVAVFLASRDRVLLRLALVQVLVVPLQALIGGLLVLSGLNPYVLVLHFAVSFPLIYAAAALLHRLRGAPARGDLLLRRLSNGVAAATVLVLVLGTLVTGTGPHAGSERVKRLPFDPREITQLHADAAFLLIGLVLATLVVAWSTPLRPVALATAWVVAAQGALGYWQYFTGVPALLVGLHVAGAALVFTFATWLHLSARQPAPQQPRTGQPIPVRA